MPLPQGRFSQGLGHTARSAWSGNRVTPNQEQQLVGFFVGQVMDDQDDQRMGRVWVFIPQVSGRRFDEGSLPIYGGTVPDRQEPGGLNFDQDLRAGWLLVSPMLPFFGADDFRNPASPDGRDSTKGDVNSYGMWYQPRIGDFVGVMFDGGETNAGYWVGMIPKQYRNTMVPGIPGASASGISDRDKSGVPDLVSDGAVLPVMDKAPNPEDSLAQDRLAASDLARNIAYGGLSGDIARGAGTSGAQRESPSYVQGWKTPGWSYDSEKLNRDTDGTTQFQDRVATLSKVNSTGHSFVMDDHPDYQSIRIRTSAGSQIFFNDACAKPYIYVQTPTGKVWIELNEGGDLNIFAAGSISMHAENNFNLTVDGDYNIQVGGSMNTLVGGDRRETIAGNTSILHQGEEHRATIGVFDHTFSSDTKLNIEGNLDSRVLGNMTEAVNGNQEFQIGGSVLSDIGGSNYVNAGRLISLEGSSIYLNSGLVLSANEAETAILPGFPEPGKVSGPPTEDDILQNNVPDETQFLGLVVPQHQPWPYRCGVGNTAGTNGLVSATPTEGAAPTSANNSCDRSAIANNTRPGASRSTAQRADSVMGGTGGGLGVEPCPTVFSGAPYATDSAAESPVYNAIKLPGPEEITPVADQVLSANGLEFIQGQETLLRSPVLDSLEQNYVVGYGHVVQVGDVIGGQTITTSDLQNISSLGNDIEKKFSITNEEAGDFLTDELADTASFLNTALPLNDLTQDQYDSLTSFVRNIGEDNMANTPEGQEILQAIRDNEFDKAQGLMTNYSHVGGAVDCDMLDRRRAEVSKFGALPNGNGVTTGNIDFVPDGATIPVGKWNVQGDVYNAVANAQADNPSLPDGYLFAIAAQESGFNPNAVPRKKDGTLASSAGGLFQFIKSTGVQYGLSEDRSASSNVFDPVSSANAGAAFAIDNRTALANGSLSGVRDPNVTDLYMAHFMGAGGANKFFNAAEANPQGTPATEGFATQAASNPTIFYSGGVGGTPKTYEEIYGVFAKKISCNAAQFADLSAIPVV